MRRPLHHPGIEQARQVGRPDGAVADAALGGLDLEQRLQPQHAAAAVADEAGLDAAHHQLLAQHRGHGLGAHRHGGGIHRQVEDGTHGALIGRPAAAARRL